MKILVLEWDISRFSGRMATMVRFADAFKRLGHDVHMCSNWMGSEIQDKKDIFRYHGCENLILNDFSWNLQRRYGEFPREWSGFDFIFVPYIAYGHLSDLPGGRPTVCWWISKQDGHSKNTIEFWTNSQTMKERLFDYHPVDHFYVVIPPYDYSIFRRLSQLWKDREYDVVYACRLDVKKNIGAFTAMVRRNELKGAIAFLCKSEKEVKEVYDYSKIYSNIDVFINLEKSRLALLFGSSKIYFHPSLDESCSIAIYEAMNAGCWPVVYDAGAAREQLDGVGRIFEDDPDEYIRDILTTRDPSIGCVCSPAIGRGFKFDIVNVLPIVEERLREIERKIK